MSSPEYYAKILEDCNKGCQRCFECHVLDCHDNLHPARVAGLERAVIDFHELEFRLRAKIARLHELNESSMAVTRRHQGDAEDHRHRMETLTKIIEKNQKDLDERHERWEKLTDAEQQELGDLEPFIEGLQTAWRILDTDGRVDEGRDGDQEGC